MDPRTPLEIGTSELVDRRRGMKEIWSIGFQKKKDKKGLKMPI